jgi:ADP-ribose pyrophosphatase
VAEHTQDTIWRGRKFDIRLVEVDIGAGGPRTEPLIEHPGSVVVVPLLGDGRVVLIRNRRYAVGRSLLELPAGTREPPEEPLTCARRELREETGYEARKMELLGSFFLAPSVSTERMVAYLATDLEPVGQRLDDGEDIAVITVPAGELRALVRSGTIEDAKSLAALHLLALREEAP